MTIIILSLLLLVSQLPFLTYTAHVGIVNGTEAKPHSRPYMVSIQSNGKHICGGFLISDQYVLTAGHCWNREETLKVVVGAHDLRESNFFDHIEVESYIKHPSYELKPGILRNDIMLFKLREKVSTNSLVNWTSIPNEGIDFEAHTPCSVAGWGYLLTNGNPSDRLMEANVYIKNNTECETEWKKLNVAYIKSQMMCVRGDGGSCMYDSGGPLVCGGIAVGVTSFGYSEMCNSPNFPNVYTQISPYRKWIDYVMGN